MAITKPLVSETMILPKPDAVPTDKSLLRFISQLVLPLFGFIDKRLPQGQQQSSRQNKKMAQMNLNHSLH